MNPLLVGLLEHVVEPPKVKRKRRYKPKPRDLEKNPYRPWTDERKQEKTAILAPHVGPSIHGPMIQAVIDAADRPLILREVATATGLNQQQCIRTLHRLMVKGAVARHKVEGFATRTLGRGDVTRVKTQIWAYHKPIVENEDQQ